MDEIPPVDEANKEISIERCRELLGDEAIDLTDDDVDQMRICADTVAQALIEMFRDEKRPTLQFCHKNKGTVQFVVVFNLTRFAREKYDHFALRAHLKSLGISLRSATEPIDDTSTGKLMEGVLAAFAQFDNDVRSERTRGG